MIDPIGGGPREYLASLEFFGIKLGLSTIAALTAELGWPDRRFPSVIIAGTNGKGSVAAMTERALRASGRRTGRYTSPHLVSLEERMAIDGVPVQPAELDEAITRVRMAAARLQDTGALVVHPTFFEATTAAAFEVFSQAGVDVAVLEVGLGGRFDATNIVMPVVAAITSIALDHEQHLGHSIEAIAYEKAGVIKSRVPVVLGDLPPAAREVVAGVCTEREAPLVVAHAGCRVDALIDAGGLTRLALETPVRRYAPVTLALRGRHQVGNAVLAVRLLEVLAEQGFAIPADAVRVGLEDAQWPARLQLVAADQGRQVLLDGAHNPAGAAALADYIQAVWPAGLPIVFGAMRDKQIGGMLRALSACARPLVATTAPGERAAGAETIAAAARAEGLSDVEVAPELPAALEAAWRCHPLAVVAGSLFLAGRTLEWLEHGRARVSGPQPA